MSRRSLGGDRCYINYIMHGARMCVDHIENGIESLKNKKGWKKKDRVRCRGRLGCLGGAITVAGRLRATVASDQRDDTGQKTLRRARSLLTIRTSVQIICAHRNIPYPFVRMKNCK